MITTATGAEVELEVVQHEDTSTQVLIKHVPLPWTIQQRGRLLLLAAEGEPGPEPEDDMNPATGRNP